MEDVVASPAPLATDLPETESRFSNNFLRLKKQLMRKRGEVIVDYGRTVEGDVVMVCVSGGKDSCTLLSMLLLRKQGRCRRPPWQPAKTSSTTPGTWASRNG